MDYSFGIPVTLIKNDDHNSMGEQAWLAMERIWLRKMILNKRLFKVVRLKEKYSRNTYSYPRGEITR